MFAAVNRVALPLLGAGVIEKLAAADWRRGVGFLEVAEHFFVKPLLEGL
jgi:hypothetical protein